MAAVVSSCPDAEALALAGPQFDSLRLRLVKMAARVVEMKTQIKFHLPTSASDHAVIRLVFGCLPQLVT